jgi:hypothetical protein
MSNTHGPEALKKGTMHTKSPAPVSSAQRPERFSIEASRQLSELIKNWMAKAGLKSTYELYLLVDVPRATLHRWLTGRVRVPVSRSREIVEALGLRAESEEPLKAFDRVLLTERDSTSWNARLRAELRARGVPIKRALDALRAANAVPAEDATDFK